MSNAPEINSFVSVVNELAKTDKATVSARIAKRLSMSVPWPPTQIESHLHIRSYQRWLESYFPGRTNRGGLGHLWNEAYKRCEHTPQQIDIEEQIAEKATEPQLNRHREEYTEAENLCIKKMFSEGASDIEIAQHLGRTPVAISVKRVALGAKERSCRQWTDEEIATLKGLCVSGLQTIQISKQMNRSYSAVKNKIFREGIDVATQKMTPMQPAPVKPVNQKLMTKPLPWWRRLFG